MRRLSVSNTVLLILCLMYLILYVDTVEGFPLQKP